MPQVPAESIGSLADKLDDFAQTLSEQERSVLGYVLTRAQAAESESEVEGFALESANVNFSTQMLESSSLQTGLSSQLGKSVGLSQPGVAAITIKWSW